MPSFRSVVAAAAPTRAATMNPNSAVRLAIAANTLGTPAGP